MKLAIVIPGFQADERDWCIPAFTNLARELSRYVGVHVFTLRYPGERRRYRIGHVRVHAVGGGAFGERRMVGLSLINLWRRAMTDIAAEHRRGPFTAILGIWATESGWLATRIARRLGVPSLVHLAGGETVRIPEIGYGNQGRGLARLLVRSCVRGADLLTVPSSPMRESLLRVAPGVIQKVRFWPLGVDTQMYSPCDPDGDERADFTFISVASLIPVKDHEWLLRAAAAVRRAEPGLPFRVEIAGAGPLMPRLQNLIVRLELQGYVDLVGEVRHDALPALYHNADCFVLTSRHEAQCMALLEAMSCGLPWIGPRVGALADCASGREGEPPSGIAIGERNVQTLAQAMGTMLRMDEARRITLRVAARRRAASTYDLGTQVRGLLRLVDELTGRRAIG